MDRMNENSNGRRLTMRHASALFLVMTIGFAWSMPSLHAQGQNPEESHYQRADAMRVGGDYYRAYYEFESFVRRYPESKRQREAVRKEMESARALAENGYQEHFLGIPMFSSAQTGLGFLRESLHRHPFEDFSDDYSLWIANYYFKEEKLGEAILEYESFTKVYPSSELYPAALFQLGRCYLRKFDAITYDTKPLREARKYLERLKFQYPYYEKTKEGLQLLAFVEEKEAEKLLMIADFYHGRGRHRSEGYYLKMIVKEYPASETVQEARRRLAEYQAQDNPSDAPSQPPEDKK